MKLSKRKPIKFTTREFTIDVIGIQNSSDIGYIRIENKKTKEYIGSFDRDETLTSLKKLRSALNAMIEEKQK